MADLQTKQRLIEALGDLIFLEESRQSEEDDTIEEIILDPLALDRRVAAIKAAKEGKSAKPSSKSTRLSEAVLLPSTSEPLSQEDYNALMMAEFTEFKDMKAGDLSKEGMTFVSWDLVKQYPMNYIGKTNRPKESAAPFFEAMTEEQTWDFFYVYHPKEFQKTPYIFVPTKQFDHFLDVINASIHTKLTIPQGQPGEKFYVVFGPSCMIRPKYIGRSSSHNEYKSLQNAIPPAEEEDMCSDATPHGMDMLMSLLNAHHVQDNDKKAKKRKKQKKQATDRCEILHDAQRYLGLRPKRLHFGEVLAKLDASKAVPYELDENVVFMCIDIEVAEEHHGTILEIGMSTLDTKDIAGVQPGVGGRNWFSHIKSRHLHTYEYRYMRNQKYLKGCPELFDFGESELIKVGKLREEVLAALNDLAASGREKVGENERHFRNLVLVGHDIESDLGYLAGIDVHPWSVSGMMRCLDTKDMHQVWRKLDQGRSLGFVLQDLDIRHKNLHNAGNDAAYTMRALLGLAVQQRMDTK